MDTLVAYKSRKDFPKDLVPGQIYVDMRRHAVLIPNSPNTFIPLHVGAIKSVSDKQEGQWTFLRINFNITNSPSMEFPPMQDPNNLFMKALTMKTQATGPHNRLSMASKQIKECIKQAKQKEVEKEVKAGLEEEHQEALIPSKMPRKEMLDNLVIRPNLSGKKTVGSLEIHQNGVRFTSAKG